jgi:hypothetical protein
MAHVGDVRQGCILASPSVSLTYPTDPTDWLTTAVQREKYCISVKYVFESSLFKCLKEFEVIKSYVVR